MSSMTFLNFKFCDKKLCIKNNFIDRMVNNIRFERNLTRMLRAQRTRNLTVKFSKFIFNEKI